LQLAVTTVEYHVAHIARVVLADNVPRIDFLAEDRLDYSESMCSE